jgi:hypothetical protein
VDLPAFIKAILTLAKNPHAFDRCEAVVVDARFTGGWYAFDFEDFRRKCAQFDRLGATHHNEAAIKRIFDIHEYKRIPVIRPGEARLEADGAAVVMDGGQFLGAWVSRYRPAAKPPVRGHF